MPPPSGDASDGRSSYDSRFKSKTVTLEDILQGAQPPLPWLSQLGPMYMCKKLLDGGGLGSLLSLAKKYPRVLVLVQDRPYLLCLKVESDGVELCSYKWLKKLVDIVRVTRLPGQGFSMSSSAKVELALEFNEIDPGAWRSAPTGTSRPRVLTTSRRARPLLQDTGGNLEEVLSFKEPDAIRFMRELDDARKAARKLQLEMGANKAAQAAAPSAAGASYTAVPAAASSYSTMPATQATPPVPRHVQPAPPPVAPPVAAPVPVAAPPPQFDASFDDSFGDFSAAAPAAAPAHAAPAPRAQASAALNNPFEDERFSEKAPPAAPAAAMDPFADEPAAAPAHVAAAASSDPFGDFAAPPVATPASNADDPFADMSSVKAALPPSAPGSGAPASLLDL
jgi:hypothetical protein